MTASSIPGVLIAGLGALIVMVTMVDVFWTVLWSTRGAGPLTMVLTNAIRRVLQPLPDRSRKLLTIAGPAALALAALMWASLLVIGFSLIFQFAPDAVVSSSTREPAAVGERIYFVGYTMFTLGSGEFVPTTGGTRAVTVLLNAVGMFLVTLSVTYLLPVISASVQSRSFASSVLSMGRTPEEVVTGAWDGTSIRLEHQLRTLASDLSELAHQHLAYPILHLFHSGEATSSAPLGVAVCDDVLTLLDAVDPAVAPPRPGRRQLRSSIETYAITFGFHISEESPGVRPSLDALREAGIPLVHDGASFDSLLSQMAEHRGRMRSLVAAAGLQSEHPPQDEDPLEA